MFVRNTWYAAAWEREIGDAPFPVTIAGDAIALFRLGGATAGEGGYAALEDACPHRKLPLTMGCVRDGIVECGYHGLQFDATGACVAAPTNGSIPPGAMVRSYPVAARYGLLWVWMGDPTLADERTIFDVEHWDDATWGRTAGDDMTVACDYLLITDNLLDPSHVAWVHPGSFAGEGTHDTPMESTVTDAGVTVWRWIHDSAPPPFYAPYLPFAGNCDRKQQYEVRYPGHALISAVFCPAGRAGTDASGGGAGNDHDTFVMHSYNFLTPVDDRTTRYFWFQLYNVCPGDDDVAAQFAWSVRDAFAEDKVILEAVQRGLDRSSVEPINLRSDTGGVRFRRRVAHLVEAEQAAAALEHGLHR